MFQLEHPLRLIKARCMEMKRLLYKLEEGLSDNQRPLEGEHGKRG
jgi:hypothetical protein